MEEKHSLPKFITIKEHFALRDKYEDREPTELFLSYNEDICAAFKESLSETLKMTTTYYDIVFGQLVMIEQILSSGMKSEETIPLCLSIFYRPKEEREFDNDNEEKETLHKLTFEEMPAGVCLSLFDDLIALRETFFFGSFNGVIYKRNDSTDAPSDDSEQSNEPDMVTNFYKAFGWYERRRTIAKELNMKIAEVDMMKAADAMIELAYLRAKGKIDEYYSKMRNK